MTGSTRNGDRPHRHGRSDGDEELAARITSAFRSRESSAPEPAFVAARIEAELARRAQDRTRVAVRRGGTVVMTGVVAGALAVGAAGAAAAASPYSDFAAAVESAAAALGIDWSAMPDGYTREQYEAFTDAGFTMEDGEALQELWGLDDFLEVKARAGQMILDGETVPVAPGSTAVSVLPTEVEIESLYDAGYTFEDAELLAQLWGLELLEAKAQAVRMLVAGERLPIEPSGELSGESGAPTP